MKIDLNEEILKKIFNIKKEKEYYNDIFMKKLGLIEIGYIDKAFLKDNNYEKQLKEYISIILDMNEKEIDKMFTIEKFKEEDFKYFPKIIYKFKKGFFLIKEFYFNEDFSPKINIAYFENDIIINNKIKENKIDDEKLNKVLDYFQYSNILNKIKGKILHIVINDKYIKEHIEYDKENKEIKESKYIERKEIGNEIIKDYDYIIIDDLEMFYKIRDKVKKEKIVFLDEKLYFSAIYELVLDYICAKFGISETEENYKKIFPIFYDKLEKSNFCIKEKSDLNKCFNKDFILNL